MGLTDSQKKALAILKNTSWQKGMTATVFARYMWDDTDTNMFTKTSNQGNGATMGKAAWLCGGSYLAKLIKKGWVTKYLNEYQVKFHISEEGKKQINDIH